MKLQKSTPTKSLNGDNPRNNGDDMEEDEDAAKTPHKDMQVNLCLLAQMLLSMLQLQSK
jgi:hypothetical protein